MSVIPAAVRNVAGSASAKTASGPPAAMGPTIFETIIPQRSAVVLTRADHAARML